MAETFVLPEHQSPLMEACIQAAGSVIAACITSGSWTVKDSEAMGRGIAAAATATFVALVGPATQAEQ